VFHLFILLQMFDDGSLANVPGVEYMIDGPEVPQDYRVEQTVGIGDHADTENLGCRGMSCHYLNPLMAQTVDIHSLLVSSSQSWHHKTEACLKCTESK
jgi:hypothetical protein